MIPKEIIEGKGQGTTHLSRFDPYAVLKKLGKVELLSLEKDFND